MEEEILIKKNDRKFPNYTDTNIIIFNLMVYSGISALGGLYIFKNRRTILSSPKLDLKILIFPLSSAMYVLNTMIYDDLEAHKKKYPELYQPPN